MALVQVWIRVEMLEVVGTMIQEGLVGTLVVPMQTKLVEDLLELSQEEEQHELLRLTAFSTALVALKAFHAARAHVLAPAAASSFLDKAMAQLQRLVGGPRASSSTAADAFLVSMSILPAENMLAREFMEFNWVYLHSMVVTVPLL